MWLVERERTRARFFPSYLTCTRNAVTHAGLLLRPFALFRSHGPIHAKAHLLPLRERRGEFNNFLAGGPLLSLSGTHSVGLWPAAKPKWDLRSGSSRIVAGGHLELLQWNRALIMMLSQQTHMVKWNKQWATYCVVSHAQRCPSQ